MWTPLGILHPPSNVQSMHMPKRWALVLMIVIHTCLDSLTISKSWSGLLHSRITSDQGRMSMTQGKEEWIWAKLPNTDTHVISSTVEAILSLSWADPQLIHRTAKHQELNLPQESGATVPWSHRPRSYAGKSAGACGAVGTVDVISLCPICRTNSNQTADPGFFSASVTIQISLSFFIDFELRDRERRTNARKHQLDSLPAWDSFAGNVQLYIQYKRRHKARFI